GLIGQLMEVRTRGKEDHRAGGEDMMVLGTHCMYLMRMFAGDPLWCTARVTQDGRDITVADRRAATEPLGPVAGDTIHVLPEPLWSGKSSAWKPLPDAPSNDHPSGLKDTAASNRYIVDDLLRI